MDVQGLLEARSVAVVGASPRPGSVGRQMVEQLLVGGFPGRITLVNPRHRDVLGYPCHPSLADAGPADLVLLGVPTDALEAQVQAAAQVGARGAVVFATAHEDALRRRLAAIADDGGVALCGPNCMGFVNFDQRLRALAFREEADLPAGPITWISHSGSAFTALLHNRRGLRFNLAVSSGQELVTTAADYLAYALTKPTTHMVALFLETVRDPSGFRAGLAAAAERDIPVVALKVGREPAARPLVAAHSGALAGEDGAYEALFDAYGVVRVESLPELEDTLELLAAGRRAARGGLAAVSDSGGERAHLVDAAARADVPLARIAQATRDRLAAVLDPGLPPVNPLDAWGTGHEVAAVFRTSLTALAEDPDTAVVALAVDLVGGEHRGTYVRVAQEVAGLTEKPVLVLSHLPSAIDPGSAADLRAAGLPLLEGTATALAAIRHLLALRDRPAPPEAVASVPPNVRDGWRARLLHPDPWTEHEALALLRDYGLPTPTAAPAANRAAVIAAGERIGWPVALKTAAPGVAHKSDVAGVRLDIVGAAALAAAYDDLAERLGPEVVVAAMAPPGVELHLGVVRDGQFGPLVLAAAGGVLVEVLADRRLALPPLDEAAAYRLLDRLAVRPLLAGVRARPPADVHAVAHALTRLSVLAADLGDLIDALDVNPLIASPSGCLAVDALLVPRERTIA